MKGKIIFFAMILASTLSFYGCTKAFAHAGTENDRISRMTTMDGESFGYDKAGNLIYKKDKSGYEYWCDSAGNTIHEKDSDGSEVWYEYDSTGNTIRKENRDGDENWFANFHQIYHKSRDGYECWYDEELKITHEKNSDGLEAWYEYDSYGNCILKKDSSGNVEERILEYDSKGNLIHLKEIDGFEFLLNENGNLIYANNEGPLPLYYDCDGSLVDEVHYEYDPKNPNHRKDLSDGSDWYFKKNVKIFPKGDPLASELCGDYWCKYDEKGRIIYFRNEVFFDSYVKPVGFESCIGQSYGKCDSDGRIQEFFYKYVWGSPDTYQSNCSRANCSKGNFRYEYYANGNLIYKHADEFGGGVHPYFKDYVFDSYGNEIFYCSYYTGFYADPYWAEYKDGKAVKVIYGLGAGPGPTGKFWDDDASPEAVLGGKSRLVSIDSLGNIKINEDYARENGIGIY